MMENKLLFDYGPVWISKFRKDNYTASKRVPLPDSITCGKILTQDFFSRNEVGESYDDTVKEEELKIKTRKNISKKFPLNFELGAKPLLNQLHYEHLPGNLGKRYHHSNILSSYELNNTNHIVYGERSKESFVLKISSLKEINYESECEIVLDTVNTISEYQILHESHAYVINGIPYVLLLVDNKISFLRLKENGFSMCNIDANNATSCCLNKDLNNCFGFTKENIVNLFDVNKEQIVWQYNLGDAFNNNNNFNHCQNYVECDFGNNPFHINVSCESKIISADTRINDNQNRRKLFDIKEFNTYIHSDSEVICSVKYNENKPFFYVACANTLLLIDQRYCKYPVLNWHHMVKGRPSYLQYFKDNNLEVAVIAEPNKAQFCFIPLESDNSEYPNITAISTPLHKNIVKDTLKFARQHEICLTDLTERQICSPIVGVSVLPCNVGNSIFFQNSYGNLFYFQCSDRKNKKFGSTETTLKALRAFEKSILKKSRKDYLKKNTKAKYIDGFKFNKCIKYTNKTIKKGENWNRLIWDITSFSNFKTYSKFFSQNEDKQIDNSMLSCFCSKDKDFLDTEYIINCEDTLSKKLLSVWNLDDDDFDHPFSKKIKSTFEDFLPYRSCPYFLDGEKVGEIPLLNHLQTEECNRQSANNGIKTENEMNDSDNLSDIWELSINQSINNKNESQILSDKGKKNKKRKSRADGF